MNFSRIDFPIRFRINRPLAFAAMAAISLTGLFLGCQDQGSNPIPPEPIPCEDPATVKLPRFSITNHKPVKNIVGKDTAFTNMVWAQGDSVKAFFGGKDIKVVFTLKRNMYLVTYVDGVPTVTRISQGDESPASKEGSINSPLFSPDGKKITFAGTTLGKPAFIQEALTGGKEAKRVVVDLKTNRLHPTADPHWHVADGKTWVYFATLPGLVGYSDHCKNVLGSTYRIEVIDDTTMGNIEPTGIAGAYRGGISKDGLWAGTSYAASTLFNTEDDSTRVLAGGQQQCNTSMNPYPPGSKHTDYSMVLGFGTLPYPSIEGDDLVEGLHENLWIFNKNDKVVWQAKRPNKNYLRWDKPEWSTHPDFAIAVGVYQEGADTGDLIVVKIGDLANADEGKLNQAQAYFKLASGGFTSDSYSHLWVAP